MGAISCLGHLCFSWCCLSSWHLKLSSFKTFSHSYTRNIFSRMLITAFWNRSKVTFCGLDFANENLDREGCWMSLQDARWSSPLNQRDKCSQDPGCMAVGFWGPLLYVRVQQMCSVQSLIVNIFHFVDHMVSIATTQLCHCGTRAATVCKQIR